MDGGGRVVLQEPQESKAYLWLCREFETNLEYTKLYFKEQRAGSGGGELVIQFNGFRRLWIWPSRQQSADFLISV